MDPTSKQPTTKIGKSMKYAIIASLAVAFSMGPFFFGRNKDSSPKVEEKQKLEEKCGSDNSNASEANTSTAEPVWCPDKHPETQSGQLRRGMQLQLA